ncbi:hypothetical protein [Microtetraspora malaysiensis]|uniref:Helix-turn-helix domain-containing protein n=1 Tax=Microtetraspora malaysiensis TaxID=161358 RepID=A0ABW6SJD1_9ACTN
MRRFAVKPSPSGRPASPAPQIKDLLGIGSDGTLNELLRDAIPPESPLRANAKDDLRARARELRLAGRSYNEIVSELGVSKSSVSLWVRDLPEPPRLSPERRKQRAAEGARRYWESERGEREARRQEVRDGAAGVDRADVAFHVCIHETADLAEAGKFWLEQTGGTADQFGNPVIKRHRPATVRSNVGVDRHGCLRVEVRRGARLHRKVEGWIEGIFRAASIESAEPALDR